MKILLIVAMVMLVGCSSTPIYKNVEVPVPVSCVTHQMIPDKVVSASEIVQVGDTPGEKIRAILVEREQLRLTNEEMRVVLEGCL